MAGGTHRGWADAILDVGTEAVLARRGGCQKVLSGNARQKGAAVCG